MRHRVLLISALSASLAACGGGSSPNTSGNSTNPPVGVDRVVLSFVAPAAPVPAGSTGELQFTLRNNATDDAQIVQLNVTLGTGLTRSGLVCQATGTATCPSEADGTRVAALPPQSSLRFFFAVLVDPAATGSIPVSAEVFSVNDDIVTDNRAQFSVAVAPPVMGLAAVTVTAKAAPSFVELQDNAGALLGVARQYSKFTLDDHGSSLSLDIPDGEIWHAAFFKPTGLARWQTGIYADLSGAPLHDPTTGGMDIVGASAACPHSGWFTIDHVAYKGDTLTALDVTFVQYCDGAASALRGQVHWVAEAAAAGRQL